MDKPVKSRWPRIWHVINSWLVALDPDRWEAMHSRMRRAESAATASAVGPPTPDRPASRLAGKKPR